MALQHVIGRGINRQEIFSDKADYKHFLERVGERYRLQVEGYDLDKLIERIREIVEMTPEEIIERGKGEALHIL